MCMRKQKILTCMVDSKTSHQHPVGQTYQDCDVAADCYTCNTLPIWVPGTCGCHATMYSNTAHLLQLTAASVPESEDTIAACRCYKGTIRLRLSAEDIAWLPACWHLTYQQVVSPTLVPCVETQALLFASQLTLIL